MNPTCFLSPHFSCFYSSQLSQWLTLDITTSSSLIHSTNIYYINFSIFPCWDIISTQGPCNFFAENSYIFISIKVHFGYRMFVTALLRQLPYTSKIDIKLRISMQNNETEPLSYHIQNQTQNGLKTYM